MKKDICEKCFEEICSDCYQHLANLESNLKAHAVEVLADKCYYNNELWDENRDMSEWEDIDEHIRNRCRAEARALLGWEE